MTSAGPCFILASEQQCSLNVASGQMACHGAEWPGRSTGPGSPCRELVSLLSLPHLISNWAQIDNPHRGVATRRIFDRQMTAASAQRSQSNESLKNPLLKCQPIFSNLAVKTLRAGASSKTQNLHVGGFGEDVGCGLTCAD